MTDVSKNLQGLREIAENTRAASAEAANPVAWYMLDDNGEPFRSTCYASEAQQWKDKGHKVLAAYAAPQAGQPIGHPVSGAMTDTKISDYFKKQGWEVLPISTFEEMGAAVRALLSASGQAVSEKAVRDANSEYVRELHAEIHSLKWKIAEHETAIAQLESLQSTPAQQTEAPSVDAVIKQSKAVLRLVDEYIDGVQTQHTRTKLRSGLMDLFAAAPAPVQTEAQQSEKDAARYRWLRKPQSGTILYSMVISGECGRNMDITIDQYLEAEAASHHKEDKA